VGNEIQKIGFLASGRGSNMQAVIDACENSQITAKPVVVVSNNSDSMALERARVHGLAAYCLNRKTHPEPAELDSATLAKLEEHQASLVVLAGFMRPVGPKVLKGFRNRIINIHPALLPKFGGKGMYGMNVHKAVIESGEKESGATVHLVNEEYDQGRILAQAKVVVEAGDTPERLAEKVLPLEHELLVKTIAEIVEKKIIL
jgi:phosphoribosylglycinamide formyltransferase-1